jgi:hypothetical protein
MGAAVDNDNDGGYDNGEGATTACPTKGGARRRRTITDDGDG